MRVLDLYGDMGQVGEFGQSLPVMRRLAASCGCNRDNGAEMPGPQSPEMQVGDLISLAFDYHTDSLCHTRIRRAVEQDAAGIAQQSNRPVCDDKRADEAGKRVHPDPAARARQPEPTND